MKSNPTPDAAPEPTVSVVIPAFNEQKLLPQTLSRLWLSLEQAGLERGQVELVVCDNASTDATADIAQRHGARVVTEAHRQIARARNTGARHARGRFLIFVDADTWPCAELIGEAVAALRSARVCGGGALVSARGMRCGLRMMIGGWNLVSRALNSACGAFVFCDAAAFRAVGGFDESLYAAEEIDLSWRLADYGRRTGQRFCLLRAHPLETSMRKLELYQPWELLAMLVRGALNPTRAFKDRRFLDAWYDGRR